MEELNKIPVQSKMKNNLETRKYKIVVAITIILLLIGVGYIANDKLIKPYYQNQGAIAMTNQIAISQTQTGDILLVDQGNLTTRNINQLCQGS